MLFTDDERRVYGPYHDGEKARFGDPFKINRTLIHLLDGEPNKVIAEYNSKEQSPLKFEATGKLAKAAVQAFELIPFDIIKGKGSKETDALTILFDFMKWCSKKKESQEPTQTSSPPSDGHLSAEDLERDWRERQRKANGNQLDPKTGQTQPPGGPSLDPNRINFGAQFMADKEKAMVDSALQATSPPVAPTAPTKSMPRVGLPSG